MEQLNRAEIDRIRERLHDHGNLLQEHRGHFEALEGSLRNSGEKLDAIHSSIKAQIAEMKADIKEDLAGMRSDADKNFIELRSRVDKTNGNVARHDIEIAQAKGGLKIVVLGMPVVTGLLLYALSQILSLHT